MNPARLATHFLATYGREYALSAALAALSEAQAYAPTRAAALAAAVAILETETL